MSKRTIFTILAFAVGPKYFAGTLRTTLWILQPSRGKWSDILSLPSLLSLVSIAILSNALVVDERCEHCPKVVVVLRVALVLMHVERHLRLELS